MIKILKPIRKINGIDFFEVYTFIVKLWVHDELMGEGECIGVLMIYPDGTRRFIANSWYNDINI